VLEVVSSCEAVLVDLLCCGFVDGGALVGRLTIGTVLESNALGGFVDGGTLAD
jgi:hypothetical protein